MSSLLFKTLCLPVTLYSAWKAVKLKNSVGGIDGLSVREFEESLKDNSSLQSPVSMDGLLWQQQ